jgi:protein TonB
MGQTEAGEQAHPAVASAPAGQDTALNEEGREAGGADGVDAVASTAEEAAGPERPSGGLGAALRAALENSPATTAPATAGEAGGSAVPSSYAEAVRSAVAPGFFDAVRTVSGSGMVLVAVVIRRDGKVMSARVVNGSGNPALDAASLSAARAAPYPPLPRSVDRSALTVHIPLRVR